jgi:hypothetical protein
MPASDPPAPGSSTPDPPDDPTSSPPTPPDVPPTGTDADDTAPTGERRQLDLIERLAVGLLDNLGTSTSAPASTHSGAADGEPDALSIGILDADDGLSVAVRPLRGADPVAELIGFTAPADWLAVGVVSTGRWAALTDDEASSGTIRRAARPVGGRARIAHVVTRAGASVVILRQDQEPPVIHHFGPHHEHFGRVDDICRRMLGLPTAAPTTETIELWAVVWVDAIMRRAAATKVSTWRDVAGVHPIVSRLTVVDEPRRASAADNVVELAATYGDLVGWDDLRVLCVNRQWALVGIDPVEANWMDAGMFSRWALAPYPELAELLVDVDDLLPERLARRVRVSCRAWGLP